MFQSSAVSTPEIAARTALPHRFPLVLTELIVSELGSALGLMRGYSVVDGIEKYIYRGGNVYVAGEDILRVEIFERTGVALYNARAVERLLGRP